MTDRWSDVSSIRIAVRRTGAPKAVLVDAEVDRYPFFGCLAQLGRDVLDAMEFPEGEHHEGYGDDSGSTNETGEKYEWFQSTARIGFKGVEVTGPVVLHKASNHSYVFKHFLDHIPDEQPLDRDVTWHNPTRIVILPVESETAQRRVFLSHSHRDKPFCRSLAKSLRDEGLYVWLDEAEIRVGESLIEKIQQGINDVDFVVAVLSSASVQSAWVRKELDIAMNQEIEGRKVKVLPLLREPVSLPPFLDGKLFADFRTRARAKTAFRSLVASIKSL